MAKILITDEMPLIVECSWSNIGDEWNAEARHEETGKSHEQLVAALKAARDWLAAPSDKHDSHCAESCNGKPPCDCPVPKIDTALRAAGEASDDREG